MARRVRIEPSKNGKERDPGTGRFQRGNKAAVGHGPPKLRSELRATFAAAVTEDDLRSIARALVAKARRGNVQAAALVLDRVLGRLPLAAEREDDFGPPIPDERFL